jgi:RalA-binding protein 1
MLSTIVEGPRPQMLARESRVSLPDEAKQYIANMVDSPVASPRADAFAAKFGAASRNHPPIQIPYGVGSVVIPGAIGEQDSPGGTKEFLDMRDEDDDDGDGEEDEEDGEDEEGEEDGDDGDSVIMVSEADADSEILPVSSVRESLSSQLQEQELQQSE